MRLNELGQLEGLNRMWDGRLLLGMGSEHSISWAIRSAMDGVNG